MSEIRVHCCVMADHANTGQLNVDIQYNLNNSFQKTF